MPGFVKTPKDEAKWSKAKKAAAKSKGKDEDSFTDQDWALSNHIYHNMNKDDAADGLTRLLSKAKDRIEDGEDLIKMRQPATKPGQITEDKNYEAKYIGNKLVWNALPHVQSSQNKIINNKSSGFISSHPEAHRPVVSNFFNAATNHELAHSTYGSNPKTRHIKKLLLGDPTAEMNVLSPDRLQFIVHDSHGNRDNKGNSRSWTYTNGKGFSEPIEFDRESGLPKSIKENTLNRKKTKFNRFTDSDDLADFNRPTKSNKSPKFKKNDEESLYEVLNKAEEDKKKNNEMDPERLKSLKDVSGHWLSYMDQARKMKADARKNPHLFAEGHRQAAHNAAHEDFNTAYHNFTQSKEYQDLSPAKRMRAEVNFKKDFKEKNPDYHKNASEAVSGAHGMHEKAQDLHTKEMDARKAHIMSGGQSNAQTYSDQEAAQHVGAGKNDEGAYSSTTIKDPAAAFAAQYKQHLAGEEKPKTKESDEYEELDNPEMKAIRHPKLDEPGNKKLINDFFQEYYPLIQKTAHRARNSAVANGVPEDKIDMSALHEAGMHGLMQAANDYHPDVGASFNTHAKGKMNGLMQSHLGSQDYVPRDMRAKMKAKDKNILAPTQVAPQEEIPATGAAASTKSNVHDVIANSGHPAAADMADRLKRVDTQRTVIRRPGK